MEKFIIIFNFALSSGFGEEFTPEEALDNHPQIKKYLKSNKAIALMPNVHMLQSDKSAEDIYSSFAPYIDRAEAVFVFGAVFVDWTGYANQKILDKISKLIDLDISKLR